MSSSQSFRIILWSVSSTGWRGDQKAVVYDAKSVGVEEHANDKGSAYWTLSNSHPQIAEFVPLERHYEISRWSNERGRWEFVGAGLLNDYVATPQEVIYSGMDYKSVLNQTFTPLTGITISDSGALNPNGATVDHNTIFNYSDLTTAKDDINTTTYTATGTAVYDVVSSSSGAVSAFSISAVATTTKTVVVSGYTASVASPYLLLKYSMTWLGTTTGFEATPQFRLRINAAPPGVADSGVPPIGEAGLVGEISLQSDSSSGVNKFKVTDREVHLFPYAAKQSLTSLLINQGAAQTAVDAALLDVPTGYQTLTPLVAYSLRKGISYSFQIYGGIYQSSTTKWYVYKTNKTAGPVTLGENTNTVYNLVENAFLEATLGTGSDRLRYSSIAIEGSDGTTSHTVYSYGQPVLDFIGDICDLEMGSRTDGGKAVFRIVKPAGGSSYNGTFKLSVGVSSAYISAGALRYPENIKQYTYVPGFSRVRNDISLIDSDAAISGSTTSTVIAAATASNATLISQYGRIPEVVTEQGFATGTDAQKEANRLLANANPNNTKQVVLSVLADGIDIWNGWDVGDSIRVTIKHGAVDINESFVISGVRWFGESDGSEKVEIDLVQGSAFNLQFPAGFNIEKVSANNAISGSFIT